MTLTKSLQKKPPNQTCVCGTVDFSQWRSQPDFLLLLCKFQLLVMIISLFISLEIDCFHRPRKINLAGINSRLTSPLISYEVHKIFLKFKVYVGIHKPFVNQAFRLTSLSLGANHSLCLETEACQFRASQQRNKDFPWTRQDRS